MNKHRFNVKTNSINPVRLVKIFLLAYLLFFANSIFAKTLTEYRASVKGAKLLAQNLLSPDIEDASFQDYLKLERETLAQIRVKIPAREKIEWHGSSLETNNQWLADKLDKFEREPRDSAKRAAILSEVGERLVALEQRLDEMENPPAEGRSKDEDKQKLAEILRREEYQKLGEKQESLFQKFYRQLLEWLAKIFPRPNFSPSQQTNFQSLSFILQMLLYALILGAIGFLIYRFAPFFVNRFRSREKREKKERVILGERLRADETAQNLFDEAERLAREGNLRGAIRKGYIALLCDLSDRNIIRLVRNKTNRDYLRDVRKIENLHQKMHGLTDNYERHWYGFDSAEESDWEEFKNGYRQAVGIIN